MSDPPDALRALLFRLIDDAALFPPGNAPMPDAVPAHARLQAGPLGWVVGRFLCPSSRLDELRAALGPTQVVELGVILDGGNWEAALAEVHAAAADPRVAVTAVEARVPEPTAAAVAALVATVDRSHVAPSVALYVEPPDSTDADTATACVAAVAIARESPGRSGRAAVRPVAVKLRCGGASAATVPSVATVAAVLDAAVRHGVALKATAGLHHPFPTPDAATGATHHGFVNLVTAAAVAGDADRATLESVLADADPHSFALGDRSLRWRAHEIAAATLAATRAERFHGFGSCSFAEPTAGLAAVGFLTVVP